MKRRSATRCGSVPRIVQSHPSENIREARRGCGPRRCPGRRRLAALLATLLLVAPVTAAANGRFPAAGLIAVDPGDPSHLVVRATYGVLTTRDAGATFHWTCEGAIGFGGYEDPMVAILADGTLIAGLFKGLSASKNGGCDWDLAGGALTDRYVVDLSAERADPSRAVLVISSGVGAGQFLTQLWESTDSAVTWTQAGADLPEDFLALTVDTAPSAPERVYLTGRFGAPEFKGALQRSLDRGQTWERFDVPGSDDRHLPYLAAVDPSDPETLYVRLDGDPTDSLLVSHDGGQTFTTAFEGQGNLLGFALSPDGATVLVGGEVDGIRSAPASTLDFEPISTVGVKCLTWVDAGLFACATEGKDHFTVGRSIDGGHSFSPLLHLDGLCGPLECAPGSDSASVCDDLWGATQLTIGSRTCGGSGGSGGSDASSTGTGPAPVGDASSCSCRLAGVGAAPVDSGDSVDPADSVDSGDRLAPRKVGVAPFLLAAAGALSARRRAARRRPLHAHP